MTGKSQISPNDQIPKRVALLAKMTDEMCVGPEFGIGHWDFIGIRELGHWDFQRRRFDLRSRQLEISVLAVLD